MSRSSSGRVVIDIDIALKKELYSKLSMDGLTLKEFFIESAKSYLEKSTKLKESASE